MKRSLADRFVNVSLFTRYVLVIIITLVIFAAWYELYYRAEQKRLSRCRAEIATLHKHARMINKTGSNIRDLYKNNGIENQKALEEFKKPFEIDDAIDYMLQQAQQVGLHIENCTSQGERKKEWYTVSPVLLNVQGTYDAIQEFFDQVNSSNFLVRYGPASLVRDDNNRVSLRCVMNYYHIEV